MLDCWMRPPRTPGRAAPGVQDELPVGYVLPCLSALARVCGSERCSVAGVALDPYDGIWISDRQVRRCPRALRLPRCFRAQRAPG